MKKTKEIILILSVLCVGLTFFGCYNPASSKDIEGTLRITNSPAGYSFSAFVFPGSTMPSTYDEYNSMTTSPIAAGSGGSSIKLMWPNGTKSGYFLVSIRSGYTFKVDVVNFSKGDATVDWNTMTDTSTLP